MNRENFVDENIVVELNSINDVKTDRIFLSLNDLTMYVDGWISCLESKDKEK